MSRKKKSKQEFVDYEDELTKIEREIEEENAEIALKERIREHIRKECKKEDYEIAGACFGIAIGSLIVSGWSLMKASLWLYPNKDFIAESGKIAIRFNDSFYGLQITNRFFYSPTISYLCFGVAIILIFVGIVIMFRDVDLD